jgi:protein-S-isoprenylcysteine O-methyltransferase Ste14
MWWISVVTPSIPIPQIARVVAAIAIAAVAGVFGVGAAAHFRRANTTVNPVKPQAATSLVTAGVYGYTRNPMYLALLLVLIAWAVLLSSPSALVGPAAFVAYLNRYQIAPEERVLSGLFGAEYVGVRRLSRASSPVALNSPWDNL